MRTMRLDAPGGPLRPAEVDTPRPLGTEVFIRVGACGVCRTDLHVFDGELPLAKQPVDACRHSLGRRRQAEV